MNRRHLLLTSLAAPLFGQPAAQSREREFYEIRWFYLRNGGAASRMMDLLGQHWSPAASRVGLGPLGIFQPSIGDMAPSVMMLSAYPTAQAAATAFDRLLADREFESAYRKANSPEPAFTRMEASLYRAFAGMPRLAQPRSGATHVFELRTYESNSMTSLAKKLEMFNSGEIGVFERLGMSPVFFGEAVFGANLPKLTYMLAFEDLAAREKLWGQFIKDPEFAKLRSQPGYSDAEIVSTISNSILHSLPFSGIR